MLHLDIQQALRKGELPDRKAICQLFNDYMFYRCPPESLVEILCEINRHDITPDQVLGALDFFIPATKTIALKDENAIDICGTGGASTKLFNVSTTAALVVAGAGVTVAKTGNKTVLRKSGSGDVLEALGVNLTLSPEQVKQCIDQIGIGFVFAPVFCKALKEFAAVRQQITGPCLLNLVGPLLNPAGTRRRLLGAWSRPAQSCLFAVLREQRPDFAFVIHSSRGVDEITLDGTTSLYEMSSIMSGETELAATHFGLPAHPTEPFLGGSAEQNAMLIRQILSGEDLPHRDIVVANAAAGLIVAGKTLEFKEAASLAIESIRSGQALNKLNQLIAFTQKQRA